MTDQELEQKLRTALEHAAPDDFQGVLARISPKARTEQAPIPFEAAARKKKRRWAPLAAAASLALVVAAGGGGWYLQNNTVASVVSLDVNPSVTLNVNAKETVLSAVPVNEDGGDILAGMDLTGVQLDVAMNAIVGALLTNGYVDELANSILITVEDDDAGRGARLQQELTDQADAILANTSVNGAILSQTIQNSQQLQALSDTYGITTGKAALIQTIVDNGNSLHTFEELVGLSINDLNLLYTSLITAPAEPSTGDGTSGSGTAAEPAPAIQSSGQASDSAYIGVEAAKSAAFAHAGLDASQVTMGEVDFDYEDGRMVYELEFYANGAEYEYDIDASTGAVVKSSQEGGRTQTGSGAGSGGASGNVPSGAGSGTAQSGAGGTSADIGREAALAAALNHAGVSQDQVYGLEVKQEYDDGRLEYEIEFKTGSWEYEYTISAADGTILDYERDD